jgi:hypothetical protein
LERCDNSNTIIAVAMNVIIQNLDVRDDEGPAFEHYLRQIENNDPGFDGRVQFGRFNLSRLSDRGAQRLGQSLLRATADHGRRFSNIKIVPDDMTASAFQYSALLDFFETGRYRCVDLVVYNNTPSPGTLAAIEHILTAMNTNHQPIAAELAIFGLSLTMQILHLVLQCPRVHLGRCRMESSLRPLVLRNDTTDHDDSPERGSRLCLSSDCDWFGILQAMTTLKTNVTRLALNFRDPVVGQLDLSSVVGFVTAQPNGMDLTLTFLRSSQLDGEAIVVEHILADICTQCHGVHSLSIHFQYDAMSLLNRKQFSRLMEHVSDSVLTSFDISDTSLNWLSPAQDQRIAVITQRNSAIPLYLQTTKLLKHRPMVMYRFHPPYAAGGKDRPKHQFVLSHALSQAADHPIFFSHCYEFVRSHSNELFGQEGRRRQAPTAAVAQPPPL